MNTTRIAKDVMKKSISNSIGVAVIAMLVGASTALAQAAPAGDRRLGTGTHELTLSVDNHKRSYLVRVPRGYDSRTPLPLLIMLHGGGGTGRAALRETGWTHKADREGFLAVFPNALARDPSRRSHFSRNPQLWNDGSDRFYADQKVVDDVRFIDALLDDLSARFAVDAKRIFVTGFSNGASMSFLLGAELSHRIAAIAPVAGALWLKSFTLKRPVPMCYLTGTADPLNLIEGGVPKLAGGGSDAVRAKPKPPVRASVVKWAQALGCVPTPIRESAANGVRTQTYCDREQVVYIAVEGLGHTWAGGKSLLPERMVGKTSNKINATEVIWKFFQRHAMASSAAR